MKINIKGVVSALLLVLIMLIPSGAVLAGGAQTQYTVHATGSPDLSAMDQVVKDSQNQAKSGNITIDPSLFNYFTENKGQWSEKIDFLAKTSFGAAEFNANGFFYSISSTDATTKDVVSFNFVGSNGVVPVGHSSVLTSNYFTGDDPNQWQTGVNNYADIVYINLWPGIDLHFLFAHGQLKYEFHVGPSADVADIQIQIQGANLSIVDGQLVVSTGTGTITDGSLTSYYADGRETIPSTFAVVGDTYSFSVGPRDLTRAFIIDPVVNSLIFSTFVGGTYDDLGYSIAEDYQGNSYVTGYSVSDDFNTTPGAYKTGPVLPGSYQENVIVLKVNSSGAKLDYSTYIGRGEGLSIKVDDLGNAYVTGIAMNGFPTTPGAFNRVWQGQYSGGASDAFVLKLNRSGGSLDYSTLVGGVGEDYGQSIALDVQGNVYVAGYTGSNPFNTTEEAFQTVRSGNTYEAFAFKLSPLGHGKSDLIYSTYLGGMLGGSWGDYGRAIAVDPQGNAYITGYTYATDFPVTAGAFQTHQTIGSLGTGTSDAFVVKLDPDGEDEVFSTYVGGGRYEQAYAIALDAHNNSYVTGWTDSGDFNTTQGAFNRVHGNGDKDVFVFKLNNTGSKLDYSTLIGGDDTDQGQSIAVSAQGYAYVTGLTYSGYQGDQYGIGVTTSFNTTANAFQPYYSPQAPTLLHCEVFVLALNPAGMGTSDLLYSTYVGGDSTSLGMGIALDISGNACVTGYASDKSSTTSNFFNVTIGAYQTVSGGRDDVIVFKLPITFGSPPGAPTGVSAGSPSLNSITVGWTAPVDTGTTALVGYDVYYGTTSPTIKFGTRFSSSATSGVVTGLLPGTTYYFAVRAANSVGVSDPSSPSASAATTNVVPGAPVLDTATAGNAQVALAWHAGTDLGTPISGYKVYRNATASPIYTGTSLACNDTGLINGVVYSYHVVATNTLGDSPSSNIMTATPDVVPNPPTGVSASSPTLTSITVSWTAPVSNGGTALTGYDVFYGTSAIPTTKFGSTLGASTFSVVVTSLSPGIQYNFTVKAINSFGASTASSPIATATTTNVVPGAPTIGTATPGYSSVTVTWSPPTNTGSPITGYKVFYGTSANPSTNFVSALSTDTGATVTGLNPGTLYFFNVVAVNAAGPGAASSDVSTTTTDVVPGAPILDSVVPGNTTAVITWHAGINNGSPVTAYKVYRNGTVAPVYAGLLLTYTDTGLINGVDYSYTVMATNLIGNSISSNTVHATPDVVPGTPVLGTITVGLNSVTVSWSAPYNAGSSITGYKVFYGTSATPTVNFASALAGDSQLVITGLNAATQYYFNIVAINAAGGSVASVDRTATTTDVIPAAPSMGTATPHLNSVTLVWTAPLANGGSPITVYRVYYGTIANPSLNYVSVSGTATGATVAGLDAGTHYYFDLVAVNSAGPGPASTDISTNTTNIVPEAPSEVVVLYPTLSSAIVSWAAPIANGGTPITGYEVYFGILLADKVKFGSTLAANATNVNVTDLQPGTYYSFEVRALNAAGAGNGSTVTASTINIVPGTPTSVEASAGVFNVTLSWTAPAANGGTDITGYRVYQVTGGSSVLLATLGLVTQYVDSGFAYNTIKTYQVSAINALGESVRTEPVTGIALFPPAPVTGLNVTRGDNGVVLTWNQTVGNASSAPVLKYAIFRGTDSTNLQLIDWVDGSLGTYVDRNTTSTETYYYEIAPVAGTTYAGEPHSNMVVELGVPHNTDWTLIGGVLVFVLLLAFLLIFVVLKRRKKKEEDK